MKKIGFIGAGNMATAIINGILKNNIVGPRELFLFDIDSSKLSRFKKVRINICDNAKDVVEKSDIIILAVKPQNYSPLLEDIKCVCRKDKVFVSIAAGISNDYIKSALGMDCPVVRVMPNTPLLLGCGATALCPSDEVSLGDFKIVNKIFSGSGITAKLEEKHMNSIIAVNGSSPAYIYLFAKAMCDYATEQGIDRETALGLTCATLKGSAEMLLHSGDSPEELIKKVSSPGGTTLEALRVLQENNFCENIKSAMEACTRRANELSK